MKATERRMCQGTIAEDGRRYGCPEEPMDDSIYCPICHAASFQDWDEWDQAWADDDEDYGDEGAI